MAHSVKSKIKKIENNQVLLSLDDGQEITVNISKLPSDIKLNEEINIIFQKSNDEDYIKRILNTILKPSNEQKEK